MLTTQLFHPMRSLEKEILNVSKHKLHCKSSNLPVDKTALIILRDTPLVAMVPRAMKALRLTSLLL